MSKHKHDKDKDKNEKPTEEEQTEEGLAELIADGDIKF